MNIELIIIPIAAGAFIATNMDNLVVLVSLLTRYRVEKWQVMTGYMLAALIFALVGFAIGAIEDDLPIEYLGFLGIIPIGIGLLELFRLFQNRNTQTEVTKSVNTSMGSAFLATLFVQLSNGADTIVTFAALFADSRASTNTLIFLTLIVMALSFLGLAIYTSTHPRLGQTIDKYGPRITPIILIMVGVYILANTATDLAPG